MANWDDNTDLLSNDDKVYGNLLQKLGVRSVTHKSLVVLGDLDARRFFKTNLNNPTCF